MSADVAAFRATRMAALALALSLGFAGMTGQALADKVGVAAAVNPDAYSSLSGTPDKQLNIGKSIFYNERINTTTSGLVQVLLLDGSTFTVGPNSDLVIDKFVYDPRKKTGEMIATFSKGTMRFIGGKLSKNAGGVTVKSPAGALAIRGGMFQGRVSGRRGTFSFLYGVSLTYSNNGHTQTVYEPGYTLDTTSGTPTIRPTTRQDTQFFQSAFSGGGTAIAGGSDNQPTNNQLPLTDTVSLQDLISDATADKIDSTLEEEEQQTQTTTTPTNNNTNTNGSNEPTTTELTLRVLTPPNTYTAYNTNIRDPSGSGILGGDDNPAVTADDFKWTFSIVNGRLVGTVTELVDSEGAMSPASVDFPETLQCVEVVCGVTGATVTQDGTTTTYEGLAVLRKNFYAYQVIGDELLGSDFNTNALVADSVDGPQDGGDGPDIILAFGGNGYNFGTPSGRTFGFFLQPDVLQLTFAPFASFESTPTVDENGPQPFVTPLLYKEADGTEGSRPVWLQTSLYINTTPADDETDFDQQSFVNIALGGIDPETGGLVGARRGGSQLGAYEGYDGPGCQGEGLCKGLFREEPESFAFTGDIASLAGPDGSHFLGTDQPNIVIGLDSTGEAHNIGNDIPLDPDNVDINNNTGATYHLGAGLGTQDPQEQSLAGTFNGYAAGMVESGYPSSGFANVVASKSDEDFSITFNPDSNTLWANLTVFDVQHTDSATGSYELNFGDSEEFQNRSAYIDNLHYAAIESGAQVKDWTGEGLENYGYTSATSYIVSGDQLGVTEFFPETFEKEGQSRPFCSGCDFIKWGAWGTRVAFGDQGPEYVDNIHLGWWVAGDITSDNDLNYLNEMRATANYSGHALGNVANRIGRNDWKTYVAAGNLTMNWNFGPRTGDFEISKFDKGNFGPNGLTFAGPMGVPGDLSNHFGGTIAGQLPGDLGSLSGSAAGSFVNNGSLPAAGVIGNWNVKGADYKATGIFAGSGIPH